MAESGAGFIPLLTNNSRCCFDCSTVKCTPVVLVGFHHPSREGGLGKVPDGGGGGG